MCGNGSLKSPLSHSLIQAVHSTRNKSRDGFIKKDNVLTVGQFVERPPICLRLVA